MNKIRLISITQTCTACPSQWDAVTDDQRTVYIRYRWGYLSVRISKIEDHTEYAAVNGTEIFGLDYGDGLDGVMDQETLEKLTEEILEFPS
jgi:hypothetical protein